MEFLELVEVEVELEKVLQHYIHLLEAVQVQLVVGSREDMV
tara:strand:- start:668 stop:790 length:123 start_codon:yes stop_codon:yes gene_type:complete